ncbi:MAG TPA: preprotein translocase subunit SecE [Verrucomicrobiae bacterium]
MNDTIKILIWVAVVLMIFAFAWRKGYLLRLSNYVQQTKEELRKCTWPTWDELKGSTVLVTIAIVAMGVFTFAVDWVFVHAILWISKA